MPIVTTASSGRLVSPFGTVQRPAVPDYEHAPEKAVALVQRGVMALDASYARARDSGRKGEWVMQVPDSPELAP